MLDSSRLSIIQLQVVIRCFLNSEKKRWARDFRNKIKTEQSTPGADPMIIDDIFRNIYLFQRKVNDQEKDKDRKKDQEHVRVKSRKESPTNGCQTKSITHNHEKKNFARDRWSRDASHRKRIINENENQETDQSEEFVVLDRNSSHENIKSQDGFVISMTSNVSAADVSSGVFSSFARK